MSGTRAFVIALAGLAVALLSPLVTLLSTRMTTRHERAMACDARRFEARRAAYVDVLADARRRAYASQQALLYMEGKDFGELPDIDNYALVDSEALAAAFGSDEFIEASRKFSDVLRNAFEELPLLGDAWPALAETEKAESRAVFQKGLDEIVAARREMELVARDDLSPGR